MNEPHDQRPIRNRSWRRVMLSTLGGLLIVAAIAVVGVIAYINDRDRDVPVVFADTRMLAALWSDYKTEYIEPSTGRSLDKQQNNLTTSEGQSYIMLRAVWQDDKETFDKTWDFTTTQLQRKDDKLFNWKFGQRSDGSYGILAEQGGQNTASDADSDIALALIFAYNRWQQSSYLEQAKPIIDGIWEQEVVTIAGKPVLAADNLEKKDNKTDIVVNPSYFSPYAYRIFSKIDRSHDWEGLADNSYAVLNQAIDTKIDKGRSAGLPPDWVIINRLSGDITASSSGQLTTNYGYDALRTSWRVALDHEWFATPEAKDTLQRLGYLNDQFKNKGKLAAVYSHDGMVVGDYESPAMYGGSMGYFEVTQSSEVADTYYKNKLEALYDTDRQAWRTKLSYYDANWAWFGLALHSNALPNLAKDLK